MSEHHETEWDEMLEEVTAHIEDTVEDAVRDAAEDAINELLEDQLRDAVYEAVQETLSQCLADFDFVLKDGTIVRPRQRMKVLSPDKSKLLVCYGGLRVDGKSLILQTGFSSWECIADYPDREAAVTALNLVHQAMEAGKTLLELPRMVSPNTNRPQ